MNEERILKPGERIFDLLDALEEPSAPSPTAGARKQGAPKIYDLVDVVEKRPKMAFVDAGLRDEIMRKAQEIAERVAREIIPEVAERVIREEIEKLKGGS